MSINGNESELISIIHGTFTYEGQSYVASPEYISQAEAYLDQDSIDCTDEQKSKAISQIYGSVAEGVKEGYLVPAGSGNSNHKKKGSKTETTEAAANAAESAAAGTAETASGKWTDTVAGKTQAETTAPETTADAASLAAAEEKARLAEESKAAEAAALEAHFKRTHNPMVLALEQVSEDQTKDTALPETEVQSIPFPQATLRTADCAIGAVVVLCLVLGLLNRRYRATGHRIRPRRNRRILSVVLSVCLMLCTVLLTGLLTLHFGFYSGENLSSAFVRTGYYESRYAAAKTEIDAFTGAIGIPENALDSANIEQWYKFEMRKTVLKNNESGYFERTVIQNVQKPINDYLNTQDIELTDQAGKGLANMIAGLIKSFQDGLHIKGLEEWYTAAAEESGKFLFFSLLTLFLLLLDVVSLFLVQQHKTHLFQYLGAGFAGGAAMDLLFYLLCRIRGSAFITRFLSVTPGELMRYMLSFSGNVWGMITAITGLLGLIFLLMAFSLKNGQTR